MVIRDVKKSLRKIVARNYGMSETAIPYEIPINLYGYIVGADALHPPVIYKLPINLYGNIVPRKQSSHRRASVGRL